MPASPVITGDNHDGLACTWLRDDQSAVDISAPSPTITFRWKKLDSGIVVAGNGVVTITNGATGQFKYVWGSVELGLSGDYSFQWFGVWPDTTKLHNDEQQYTFRPAI